MLQINNIIKQYDKHRALNDVSFNVAEGSIFGLLGPNGAGKTSLIRIINQITAPDSGSVLFNGEPLAPKHIGQIGYLPEERGLYKKMKVGEQLVYLARLKGLTKTEVDERARYWFHRLGIEDWWNKRIEELSKGMQQKVQFVSTVMHRPLLLILDEPFSGFDPINADVITNEIQELNRQGTTIIFSTHRMESVEQLCDSIVLINRAEKVLDGRVQDIRRAYRNRTYRLHYSGPLSSGNHSVFEVLEYLPSDLHQAALIQLNPHHSVNDLLQALIPQVQVEGLEELIPSMHEVFVSVVDAASSNA